MSIEERLTGQAPVEIGCGMKQPDGVICFATNCNHDHSKMTEDQRVYQNHHLDYIRSEYSVSLTGEAACIGDGPWYFAVKDEPRMVSNIHGVTMTCDDMKHWQEGHSFGCWRCGGSYNPGDAFDCDESGHGCDYSACDACSELPDTWKRWSGIRWCSDMCQFYGKARIEEHGSVHGHLPSGLEEPEDMEPYGPIGLPTASD